MGHCGIDKSMELETEIGREHRDSDWDVRTSTDGMWN